MKNVTISMDDQLLRRVRLEAGRAGVSVSRWIGAEIQRVVDGDAGKGAARRRIDRFLDTFPGVALSDGGKINIDRDKLYDEERFRRFEHSAVSTGRERSGQEERVRGVAVDPEDER